MTSHVLLADAWSTQVNFVLPLLNGLFQGSAYGLLGLGLVLLYKSNRIFNFAQGVLPILAVGAYVFCRYTPTGTAILAVSQDSTAARVVGIPVGRISLITWIIAGLLGGVAGILLAPTVSVTPGSFTGTVLTTSFA